MTPDRRCRKSGGWRLWLTAIVTVAKAGSAGGQEGAPPAQGGPFNATFLAGGIGIERDLAAAGPLVAAGAAYSLSAWVRPSLEQDGEAVLLALGTVSPRMRALLLDDGRPALCDGTLTLRAKSPLPVNRWTHLAVVSDGRSVALLVNGRRIVTAPVVAAATESRIAVAPARDRHPHFGGDLVDARVEGGQLSATTLRERLRNPPTFDIVQMTQVGVGWPLQRHATIGQTQPQDAWTLPRSRAGAFTSPIPKPPSTAPVVQPIAPGRWQINGWKLATAGDGAAEGAALSRPGVPATEWLAATVPGTVLQTYVDRGVYPDPYFGLNNLRIPEKLARQDYWYRTSFTVPRVAIGKRLSVVFGGINYAAEVWANGSRIGRSRGAFIRGQFDLVPVAGENVIAVRVSPPPHPGIPHEQSIAAGVGENGGQLAADGPTFVATEGWDWIPGIRDRNTGLWRAVELVASGQVKLGDPQVITDLPLPRIDSADLHIAVPLRNLGDPVLVTVRVSFEGVDVAKRIVVPTGASEVRFDPKDFPELHLSQPKLWWPNGYGAPHLYDIRYEVADAGGVSDTLLDRFGVREVSYDLSLFDRAGSLRRVNVQTTDGLLAGTPLVDGRHQALKQSPHGWAASLTATGETSPAVIDIPESLPEPHLTLRVNGVRIAARGGNWGMDDAMKRVSYARLAPFFRLQREAHMNVIRNWMGTNTEEEFYDLADENGMMVLNDFWQSTQNYQVEPDDAALFLANARDTIARYRNHPSIVLWFGRNEGVPYPTLNEGLADAVFRLDGTRWYTGSSNTINLQGSGPYNYRPPEGYFTDLASGFSVETGTPSLATRESIASYIPAADRWPLSDVLAYHDWHVAGNGDTKTFMSALESRLGRATSFEDFERKAQLMNLETHKAIYEGFLGHLWTKNSGRLLWMSHPAWPSNAWQLYSWDYDTHAAYYGAKKATEPLHIQLNLPGNEVVLVNTTRVDARDLTATVRVVGLDNRLLLASERRADALANRSTLLPAVPLDRLFEANAMVLVRLRLTDAAGREVSDNFYWRARDDAAYRALGDLAPVALTAHATAITQADGQRAIRVALGNDTTTPALSAKLTLVGPDGSRILPAFYDDNYLALLPGERRTVTVRFPAGAVGPARLTLAGWNVVGTTIEPQ